MIELNAYGFMKCIDNNYHKNHKLEAKYYNSCLKPLESLLLGLEN